MKFTPYILTAFIFMMNPPAFAQLDEEAEQELHYQNQAWKDLYTVRTDKVLNRKPDWPHNMSKARKIIAMCNFQRQKVEDLQELGASLGGMKLLRKKPDDSMDSETLEKYLTHGSSQQKLKVVEILIARDEIEEYMNEKLLVHPVMSLRPYDMAYTQMVLKIMDYAFHHEKKEWIIDGLHIIQQDLNIRLNQWFFSNDGYLSLVASQYFWYVSQLQYIGIPEFDIHSAGINGALLFDKKWGRALRHNKGLSLQYSFLWDIPAKPIYAKEHMRRQSVPLNFDPYYAAIDDVEESA